MYVRYPKLRLRSTAHLLRERVPVSHRKVALSLKASLGQLCLNQIRLRLRIPTVWCGRKGST